MSDTHTLFDIIEAVNCSVLSPPPGHVASLLFRVFFRSLKQPASSCYVFAGVLEWAESRVDAEISIRRLQVDVQAMRTSACRVDQSHATLFPQPARCGAKVFLLCVGRLEDEQRAEPCVFKVVEAE